MNKLSEKLIQYKLPNQLFVMEGFDSFSPAKSIDLHGPQMFHYDGYSILSGTTTLHITMILNFIDIFFDVKKEECTLDILPFETTIYVNNNPYTRITDDLIGDLIATKQVTLRWAGGNSPEPMRYELYPAT